jgi:hypothetical protein
MGKKGLLHPAGLLGVIIVWQGLAGAQEEEAGRRIGMWRSQLQTPWGVGFGETILLPNGTFYKTGPDQLSCRDRIMGTRGAAYRVVNKDAAIGWWDIKPSVPPREFGPISFRPRA